MMAQSVSPCATRPSTDHYTGAAGVIDCALDWPDAGAYATPRGWALVLHPHPLHGGARDNKVVTTIARVCVAQGLVAVRPDFRGVGQSAGTFDQARGETADMQALVTQFAQRYPDVAAGRWLLAGFSFGTAVAAQLYAALAEARARCPDHLVLAGSAVGRFQHRAVRLPAHALLVHGGRDEVVPLQETLDWASDQAVTVTVIPGASHFFHGKLIALRDLVQARIFGA